MTDVTDLPLWPDHPWRAFMPAGIEVRRLGRKAKLIGKTGARELSLPVSLFTVQCAIDDLAVVEAPRRKVGRNG